MHHDSPRVFVFRPNYQFRSESKKSYPAAAPCPRFNKWQGWRRAFPWGPCTQSPMYSIYTNTDSTSSFSSLPPPWHPGTHSLSSCSHPHLTASRGSNHSLLLSTPVAGTHIHADTWNRIAHPRAREEFKKVQITVVRHKARVEKHTKLFNHHHPFSSSYYSFHVHFPSQITWMLPLFVPSLNMC